jgi:hypothetical protein
MSKGVIFLKLRLASGNIIQLILIVHAFYAFEYPMFFSHHNHENNITIIPYTMGTHQSNPLGGALFALTHLKVLCFYNKLFSFLSISIHCK